MKTKGNYKKKQGRKPEGEKKNDPEGYPMYPENEDIYSRDREETNIDPEDVLEDVESLEDENPETAKLKISDESMYTGDIDVPGSELDDDLEIIGSEDEENNYYSNADDDDEEEL
jgi:hypothetical protein